MSDPKSLDDRLDRAAGRLAGLRRRVEAGAPWKLSSNFGVESEAYWNPPELLAHLAEMLPYWLGEMDRVLDRAARGAEPIPFGRVQADAGRLGAIAHDRTAPIGELFERIGSGADRLLQRARTLTDPDWGRHGAHPTRGELTVAEMFDRFVVSHLEEHVAQLEEILDRPTD
jgi:DinB superfamily